MSYKVCKKCVLEASPFSNLAFDQDGVCNMCRRYENYERKIHADEKDFRKKELESIITRIKVSGKNKQYDCILGISGGFDSAYLALTAKELGLRPLVVHFDNGWNSELSVQNVYNLINRLGFHLYTYVIDWDEFKDLQIAYLKASVLDIEIPTDHFIYATMYKLAAQKGIKYILDGNNYTTEFPDLCLEWSYSKVDLTNLIDIHKKFGTVQLKKFPKLGIYQRFFYDHILKIRTIRLLDYFQFNKRSISERLTNELDWREPGGKHYESIYTRFYQGYILPRKFEVDKRRLHYSNLIWSGQMDRESALKLLEQPPYDHNLMMEDKEYVLKKLNFTETEFDQIMNQPIRHHEDFDTEQRRHFIFLRIKKLLTDILKKPE